MYATVVTLKWMKDMFDNIFTSRDEFPTQPLARTINNV